MANPMLSVMCALHAKSTCTATGDICSLSERVDAPIRIELLEGFMAWCRAGSEASLRPRSSRAVGAWSGSELSIHQALNPSCINRRRDD